MAPRRICAACGRPISRRKGLAVGLWREEGLEAQVCSLACREAYEAGTIGPRARDDSALPSPLQRWVAAAILAVSALVELLRAAAAWWVADPLGMVVPWGVHAGTAAILALVAVFLAVDRRGAAMTAMAVSLLVALAQAAAVGGSGDLRPLLVPASLTVPLFLTLLGRPGTPRVALALAAATLLPAFFAWRGTVLLSDRAAALARIEAASVPGRTLGGAPGSIRLDLPEGWVGLRPGNGLVDWPLSELEAVHPGSGAVLFVVYNPDCDRRALPELQARSLEALAAAGGDPVVTGLGRLPGTGVELRVDILREGRRVRSWDFFVPLGDEGNRGCIWLHCTGPSRGASLRRERCRAMATSIEPVAGE